MATEESIDYGPLSGLIGTWQGDKGMDRAPEPDGEENSPYYETIRFEGCGTVSNAESQTLAVVRYHQVVSRQSDNQVFHDEVGYWMWDAATQTVMHSLAIPRAVCLLAGGEYQDSGSTGAVELNVAAKLGDPDWNIAQSPFMRDNARTVEFRHQVRIEGDQLSYHETTMVEIYGKSFEHTDANELVRQ